MQYYSSAETNYQVPVMHLITVCCITTPGVSFAIKDINTTAEIETQSRHECLITHYSIPKRQHVLSYKKMVP